jgi:hypothetical protein
LEINGQSLGSKLNAQMCFEALAGRIWAYENKKRKLASKIVLGPD